MVDEKPNKYCGIRWHLCNRWHNRRRWTANWEKRPERWSLIVITIYNSKNKASFVCACRLCQSMKAKSETREKNGIRKFACTSSVNGENNPFANLLIAHSSPIYVNYLSGRRVCALSTVALRILQDTRRAPRVIIICRFIG